MNRSTLAVLVVVVVALGAQFVRPDMMNPPTNPARTLTATERVPAGVTATLQRACQDCHSNDTRWPWYAQISPASWLLADHVADGRRELNLSEWGTFQARRRDKKLQEICEQLEHRKMPLTSYLWLHPEAAVSDAEVKAVCDWTKDVRVSASGAR